MKEDILTSLDLIKEPDEKAFRPVIIPTVVCKKINLSDINQVRKCLITNIQVEFRH
jgi:hypothetical protein